MNNADREKRIVIAARAMHLAWMEMVNFHHPGMISSRSAESQAAFAAQRKVRDAYDAVFAHLTAECELRRQGV